MANARSSGSIIVHYEKTERRACQTMPAIVARRQVQQRNTSPQWSYLYCAGRKGSAVRQVSMQLTASTMTGKQQHWHCRRAQPLCGTDDTFEGFFTTFYNKRARARPRTHTGNHIVLLLPTDGVNISLLTEHVRKMLKCVTENPSVR